MEKIDEVTNFDNNSRKKPIDLPIKDSKDRKDE